MKIGFLCPDDLSVTLYARAFARELPNFGAHEIVAISPIVQGLQLEIAQMGVRHREVPMHRFLSVRDDFAYIVAVWRVCREEEFDVVFNWTTKPNVYGPLAEWLAGVPYRLAAVRGRGAALDPQMISWKAKCLQQVLLWLYRISFSRCQWIWFTNRGDCDFFLLKRVVAASKTFITPNAIDIGLYSAAAVDYAQLAQVKAELTIHEHHMVVVMVARLVWSKGIREFCEAAKLLRVKYPHVRFVLVAPREDNRPDAVPVEYVRDLHSHGSITWLEFRTDIREIYQLSSIAVLPSYYPEGGYPRALLEPMALGKPVIAADTDETRGPVLDGENGFLVPPRDAQALARAIETLVLDARLRERFGMRSRKLIEERFNDTPVVRTVLSKIGITSTGQSSELQRVAR